MPCFFHDVIFNYNKLLYNVFVYLSTIWKNIDYMWRVNNYVCTYTYIYITKMAFSYSVVLKTCKSIKTFRSICSQSQYLLICTIYMRSKTFNTTPIPTWTPDHFSGNFLTSITTQRILGGVCAQTAAPLTI
jgi:hypothetical protein